MKGPGQQQWSSNADSGKGRLPEHVPASRSKKVLKTIIFKRGYKTAQAAPSTDRQNMCSDQRECAEQFARR
jgi:hypothetical protein